LIRNSISVFEPTAAALRKATSTEGKSLSLLIFFLIISFVILLIHLLVYGEKLVLERMMQIAFDKKA